ncbi:MAG TPA: PD-(D/E)XK nuclease family protein [Thermoleophilaceae bacterium]
MPLTLVTGPANAAKAGEVLGGLRDRLAEEPILVVPAFWDVEHNQRELAERGAVFGARVLRFEWLFRLMAERGGYAEPVASEVQRELILEEAVRSAGLRELERSAGRAGFVKAALRFVTELERSMVEPARFTSAMQAWAGDGPRAAYAREVAAVYSRYRDGLERAGLVDRPLFEWRTLNALRREPAGWRRTPVYVYGFDDFTPLEVDALDTLAGRCEADVMVSLPFETGRAAFRGVAEIRSRLLELGAAEHELGAQDRWYDDDSRAALNHLERKLFELEPGPSMDPGPAVRLHQAGGERAEVELVAAEVLDLLRDDHVAPGDVAVVFRDPGGYATLVEQVFDAYGLPFSIDRSVKLRQTALGRGLLALLRCARLNGTAEDLLAWLRTPGKLEQPALADRLEARVRQAGARTAPAAREIFEDRGEWKLEELDRLAEARDLLGLLRELDFQLRRLFAGPYRRKAPVLAGAELEDARAFDAAQKALAELYAVVRADPRVALDPQRVHDTLAELDVHVGENPQPDRVQVASPLEVRARRFKAVFICGLQEGEFPRGSRPDPFLPDADRRELAMASGLLLPLREDVLERERYLFYVCASRAERLLVLSSRYSGEEGEPQAVSFFVEDVSDLFEDLPLRRRSLSDVTWPAERAPTYAEYERSVALAGPREEPPEPSSLTAEPVLRWLGERPAVAARALEDYADCPVKWLVDDVLKPQKLEPDPEALVRGLYAHEVLRGTFEALREATGSARITDATLPTAERLLLEELRTRRSEFQISPERTRVKAAMRRLEFDLLRFIRFEAQADGAFEPCEFELDFGMNGEEPVEIARGVRVRGKIDRVDRCGEMAVVRDYKSSKSAGAYKVASWESENRFQAGLYMLVARERLGLEPVAGVYVALGSDDRRPRGVVLAGVEELGAGFHKNDTLDPDEFERQLDWAREQICRTAARMRGGELGRSPETCRFDHVCAYPSICRSET